MKTLKYGYRYEIKNETGRYRFAIPLDYADGCYIGDCWLVDKDGQVDPDFNVSPVPFFVDELGNPVKTEID